MRVRGYGHLGDGERADNDARRHDAGQDAANYDVRIAAAQARAASP